MPTPLLTASNNASSPSQNSQDTRLTKILAYGTWGGGTLTLEYSSDDSTYVSSGSSLTANGSIEFQEAPGLFWRVTLAGATGGSITSVAF